VYDPQYWGMVFPLGIMYTVCTIRLSEALALPFLLPMTRCFFFVALAAWLWVFVGLLCTLVRCSRRRSTRSGGCLVAHVNGLAWPHETRPYLLRTFPQKVPGGARSYYLPSSSSNALASWRSAVSKPSVNQW
jgi:hypothetical protein